MSVTFASKLMNLTDFQDKLINICMTVILYLIKSKIP